MRLAALAIRFAFLFLGAPSAAWAGDEANFHYQALLRAYDAGTPRTLDGASARAGVANAGDVDRDGREDLLVWSSEGAHIVHGRDYYDWFDMAAPREVSALTGLSAVYEAANVGDVSGDGVDDIGITGTAAPDGRAAAWVVFGGRSRGPIDLESADTPGFRIALTDSHPTDGYGRYNFPGISGLGDVSGDGRADIGIGEPNANQPERLSGQAAVVFGSDSPATVDLADPGARGFRIHGGLYFQAFGARVAGPGDVDGDGHRDIAISTGHTGPGRQPGQEDRGHTHGLVYVVSLAARTTDVDLAKGFDGFLVKGAGYESRLGPLIGVPGDLDGDGLADLVLQRAGYTLVVRGSPSDETVQSDAPGARAYALQEPALVGWFVDVEPVDWNADGHADVAVAYSSDTAYVLPGPVRGGQEVEVTSALLRVSGRADQLAAADFNGDGQPDLAALNGDVLQVVSGKAPRPIAGACAQGQAGGDSSDVLRGTNSGDWLSGGLGDDELLGLDGVDCLAGDAGSDVLTAGPGDDRIVDGEGDDRLDGGPGDDVLDSGPGSDTVLAGPGDDSIRSGEGGDVVDGGAGNDLVEPGFGRDEVRGAAGDDLIDARDGEPESVDCGEGVDFAYADPDDSLADCEPFGPYVQVSTVGSSRHPDIPVTRTTDLAYDETRDRFLVVWVQFGSRAGGALAAAVVGRFVDGRGVPAGPILNLSGPIERGDQLVPAASVVALAGGTGFLVAWAQPTGAGDRQRPVARVITDGGVPQGPPLALGGVPTKERGVSAPELDRNGRSGEILATWGVFPSWRQGGPGFGTLRARAVSPTGALRGAPVRFGSRRARFPALATGGKSGWLVAWPDGEKTTLMAQWLRADGRPRARPMSLAPGARCCRYVSHPEVVYEPGGGRYFATWVAERGEVLVARVTRAGARRPRALDLTPLPPLTTTWRRWQALSVTPGRDGMLLALGAYEGGNQFDTPQRQRIHAYWLTPEARVVRPAAQPPPLGVDYAAAHAAHYSPRESRFMITLFGTGSTEPAYYSAPYDAQHVYARSWPGSAPR